MKVLIVSQYFWPENFRINDLAQALGRAWARNHRAHRKPNYPGGTFFAGYGTVWPDRRELQRNSLCCACRWWRGALAACTSHSMYLSFALSASLIGPWRCRGSFDVIFAFEPSPITVALPAIVLKRSKAHRCCYGCSIFGRKASPQAGAIRSPVVLGLLGKMVRGIYRCCDIILAQSRDLFRA
jgi:hypothetical protein